MQIELHCPGCSCRFAASPETSFEEIRARMFDEGPWYELGDGATFERYRTKAAELKEEMDEILDEIDSVLEENAEEFVKSYVQKGGE